jgi:hypothetical protein
MKKKFVCPGSPGGRWEDFMLNGVLVATIDATPGSSISHKGGDGIWDIGIDAEALTDENCKQTLSKAFDCEAEIEWKGEILAMGS